MDRIFLTDIRVETLIGVHDWERAVPQVVRIDLELMADLGVPGQSDDVADTVDYQAVADGVRTLASGATFKLVERLAEAVAGHIMDGFPVSGVRVTLHKPGALAGVRDVGVVIERGTAAGD